ncbi:DNA alkylation repair protein [Treponema ruminis]|uniref:3-methyladenine DNA glycosylase AlkD n=1 Tax=Treponema ruminis TaxID=744515 RepID=A0A7W8LLL2_9SPIR|nr:DNA alkylation repair protein [Treponema ruminis]MBB5225500.1 3-methyladenine DNA glycosylase AlkD [Treponema ruminis]QSI01631.1 DNA alkylation repair protein [Treponema ruminis]
MTKAEITPHLFSLQDIAYRDFQAKLIPNIALDSVIGVRTPLLRSFAKELYKEGGEGLSDFLSSLPHKYFDENQLHAFLISEQKDFEACLALLENFLPFINNWATCDQLSPKVFKKNHEKLLPYIEKWLESGETYTIRFAVGMLMQHFLDEDFNPDYLEKVASIRSQEYYVNMMLAWYFATALAKQYQAALPFIEQKKLDVWAHNKAIQKSIESYRISPEQKEYLRSLKIR